MPTKSLWVYHEWLTGVFFYVIYKFSGSVGLQLLRYIVILLTLYLIYQTALKRGGTPLTAATVLIPTMLLISFGYVPVRAQIFTYLFFILTLYLLECTRKNHSWEILWWLLPIQILWCNMRGGFIAGLGLTGIYAFGELLSGKRFIPYIKFTMLATLVTLLNPYGIEYWLYIIKAIVMPRPDISEWMSVLTALDNDYQRLPVYTYLLLALSCSFLVVFRKEINLTDIFILVVTIYLGAKHIRHNILFGIVFGSYVPVILKEQWEVWKKEYPPFSRFKWLPLSMPLVFLSFIYLIIYPPLSIPLAPSFTLVTPQELFPVGAVRWLKNKNVKGNILPHFDWGEYLIWTCYPECRVAMDGRYETVYEDNVSQEYFDFLNGREKWDIFLKKYPHDIVLIMPKTKTHLLMQNQSSWSLAYSDSGCVLFLRNTDYK